MKKRKILSSFMALLLLCCQMALFTPAISAEGASDNQMIDIKSLTPLGGDWSFGDTIKSNGSGDIFALTDVSVSDFVFEADVKFKTKSGAASLIFLSGTSPSQGSYCANVDLSQKNARIFRFRPGGADTIGEYSLTSSEASLDTFHLRVEVIGANMLYFLNGKLIISVKKL